MNITLTNLDAVSVPFSSSQDRGFVSELHPNEPYNLDVDTVTVASVGDNPSFFEEVEEAVQALVGFFTGLLTFWRNQQTTPPPHQVHVMIENHGPNALRVLLGSNVDEQQVDAGATFTAQAPEYVEIRELGV